MLWVRMPSEFYLPAILRRYSPDSRRCILSDGSLSFENNALGNYIVEEHTVVRDEEDRALVIAQQIFKQFLGVDVQVVGRFVQNQNIGGTSKEFCQQKAVAFAAGE